jgi:predicted methyltransferase
MEANQHIFLTPPDVRQLHRAVPTSFPVRIELSMDAGMSRTAVTLLSPDWFEFQGMRWPVPSLPEEERTILIWRNQRWEKWQHFDELTQKFYKMVFVAEGKPPTVEISGIKMHVTQDGDPLRDTHRKIRTLGQLTGRVLDTCLGLGYTAIAEAESPGVEQVVVCEADPNMVALCAENPWSQPIFTHPAIQLITAPVEKAISLFPDGYFSAILHDPPRFSLAPQLYHPDFYRELYRVLKTGGKLYHYTGNPRQRQRKRPLAVQTAEKLQQVGFVRVRSVYQGVLAGKW